MPRTCFLALLMILSSAFAVAQKPPSVVAARMILATDGVHAGSTTGAAVEAQITAGYHINDHHPTEEYLIPTEVKFDPSKQLSVEKVVYPKGELQKFAFADQPLSVYENTLLVEASLKVASGTAPGNYPLKGKLTYQACNDHACLPPTSVPLALTVKVVGANVPVKRVNPDVFNRTASR